MRYRSVEQFLSEIRDVLHRTGSNQRELARMVKVPHSQLNRWLQGHTIPRLDAAILIEQALLKLCARYNVPRHPVA